MGKWRSSSTVLDLGTRLRWVVNFTPRPLYSQGRKPPGTHLIGSRVDPRVGLDAGKKRRIPCPCRDSNLDSSTALAGAWSSFTVWLSQPSHSFSIHHGMKFLPIFTKTEPLISLILVSVYTSRKDTDEQTYQIHWLCSEERSMFLQNLKWAISNTFCQSFSFLITFIIF
jgi:hypothetical protein